jgi:hypothetical protein
VIFDQELDQATAEYPGNIYFNYPALTITSVTWEGSTVLLEAPSLSMGGRYNIYAINVEDTEGNSITEDITTWFRYTPENPLPQIGLWSDLGRNEDFVQASPFHPFEFCVWCRPGPNGTYGTEFMIAERSLFEFQYGIISIENDPDKTVSIGDPFSGFTIAFNPCKTDWFWVSKCTAFLISGDGYLEVVPHPEAFGPNGVLCTAEREIVQMEITSRLSFQTVVATLLQNSSAEFEGESIKVTWTLSEIDDGINFTVLRRSGDGDFTLAPSQRVSRNGLEFEYLDPDVERGATYTYRVEYLDGDRTRTLFETEKIETPAMSLALDQNRPNPFNPSTEIRFSLPKRCSVRLDVYDAAGRLVRVLQDGAMTAGRHSIVWDGTNDAGRAVGSGVYFYRLRAGKEAVSKKMVLLR